MILGVIEIGSGTTRLQVANIDKNGAMRPIRVPQNTETIDLAMALESGRDALVLQKMEEIEKCIGRLKKAAEAVGAITIGCFGTEAIRKISEKKIFDFDQLSSRLNLRVRVLPSGGEAELGFWAVVKEPMFRVKFRAKAGDAFAVIDLGSASTDIAIGDFTENAPKISNTDNIAKGRRSLIKEFREKGQTLEAFSPAISSFLKAKALPRVAKSSKAVLLGGIATKHAWMKVRRDEHETYDRDPKRVDGVILTVDEFDRRANQVLEMARLDQDRARTFVDPRSQPGDFDEVDAVIAGGVFIAHLLSQMRKEQCMVSSQTARFGALHLIAHEHMRRSV
jgi:exopolyphosphatase/pppGpp-phosphohydrolase